MKRVRVLLGLPWYQGPDPNTYQLYFEQMHYYGRLRERCEWLNWIGEKYGRDDQVAALKELPLLDPMRADGDSQEITLEDDSIFEFGLTDETSLSLPGWARERCVENALKWNADWIFFWDADMRFPWSTFLKLWRHQKPVIAALAFTAREPTYPVISRILEKPDTENLVPNAIKYIAEPVFDYPKDQLIGGSDIGGSLAFGTGVCLINLNVFRQIPKPWFHSTGCGEDFMFCVRCHLHGVPRYVDTATKTQHKKHNPSWIDESVFLSSYEANPEEYAALLERLS